MKRNLLVLVLVIGLLMIGAVQVTVASSITYNPTAALNWAAANNWNNGRCNTGRACATYVARTMNAGGLPISWNTVGNDQIFGYLTGNRHGYALGYPNLQQLASLIRQHPNVREVLVNASPTTVRAGDIVFFDVKLITNSIGLNWRWGATHSAVFINNSPRTVAYWCNERYGVSFSSVDSSFSGDNIVVRFR